MKKLKIALFALVSVVAVCSILKTEPIAQTQRSQADMQLLARAVNGEARGEIYEGQVAVAAVILNRVDHPSFPNSISGVIYQSGAFSCLYDGQWDEPIADSAYQAAREALMCTMERQNW